MKRSQIMLCIVIAMVLLFSGCGKPAGDVSSSQPSSQPSSQAVSSQPPSGSYPSRLDIMALQEEAPELSLKQSDFLLENVLIVDQSGGPSCYVDKNGNWKQYVYKNKPHPHGDEYIPVFSATVPHIAGIADIHMFEGYPILIRQDGTLFIADNAVVYSSMNAEQAAEDREINRKYIENLRKMKNICRFIPQGITDGGHGDRILRDGVFCSREGKILADGVADAIPMIFGHGFPYLVLHKDGTLSIAYDPDAEEENSTTLSPELLELCANLQGVVALGFSSVNFTGGAYDIVGINVLTSKGEVINTINGETVLKGVRMLSSRSNDTALLWNGDIVKMEFSQEFPAPPQVSWLGHTDKAGQVVQMQYVSSCGVFLLLKDGTVEFVVDETLKRHNPIIPNQPLPFRLRGYDKALVEWATSLNEVKVR